MDSADQARSSAIASNAFAHELRWRLVEARASLSAADAMQDPLLAQIAESDLADLRSLARRNDIDPDEVDRPD